MPAESITRLLVANRGEIARRIFATCARLGIQTVAVVSDADRGAPFALEADVAVHVGGRAPSESYLRQDAVLDAAVRSGADAIHPGYGFLSENAGFARAVLDRGLRWIGPSPEAIAAMGSKTEARTRMQAAGVPVLPGVHLGEGDDVAAAGRELGFPLLVKASAGGGGRGMRVVASAAQLEELVEAARREAAAAFGDPTVFLERYVPRSRHIEVQLVGDAFGTVVALNERDCSVQRRHQKVIEEAPSPAVDPALRERLNRTAVLAGAALDYTGAGTVEFLAPVGSDEFFFLEVNTRLQVEHPVTEAVTGLDLVELQILVAEGRPLPDRVHRPDIDGWAIEARLYAEDPENDYLPVTGRLDRFRVPGDVRVDTGVRDGSEISPFYDPMIAKVIAHGATRADAARRLADALSRAEIRGMTTNRELLVGVLRHPEFLAGEADTGFLDRHPARELGASRIAPRARAAAALAVALALQARRRAAATVLRDLPTGWRNNPAVPREVRLAVGDDVVGVRYAFARDGASLTHAEVGGELLEDLALHECTGDEVRIAIAGVETAYGVDLAGDRAYVSTPDGELAFRVLPRFDDVAADAAPGSLTSPMPGVVVRVDAAVGDAVRAGDPLLVLEAMKMEHEIVAPDDGVVTAMHVATGDQVDAGALLVLLDVEDDDGR